MGKISPKKLYRSNHPICNGKQDPDIVMVANYAQINTIINLSDNIQSLLQKIMFCPWYKKIYENNNVISLNIGMQFNIMEQRFNVKIKRGLLFMIEHNPPYLIHCEAGIDGTGFFSFLIESFMGVKFDDIVKDYMLSYVESDKFSEDDYKNGSIFIQNMFSKIKGELLNSNDDLLTITSKYLIKKIGLSEPVPKSSEG
jgi:protein tyrosine/serine phosphatase